MNIKIELIALAIIVIVVGGGIGVSSAATSEYGYDNGNGNNGDSTDNGNGSNNRNNFNNKDSLYTGGDENFIGSFNSLTELLETYPTANTGNYAYVKVGDTTHIYTWNNDAWGDVGLQNTGLPLLPVLASLLLVAGSIIFRRD
jgi:hypothetical protein